MTDTAMRHAYYTNDTVESKNLWIATLNKILKFAHFTISLKESIIESVE